MNTNLIAQMERMEKCVDAAKRALAASATLSTKAANRGQKPYYRNGKLVRGHGEQDGGGKQDGRNLLIGMSERSDGWMNQIEDLSAEDVKNLREIYRNHATNPMFEKGQRVMWNRRNGELLYGQVKDVGKFGVDVVDDSGEERTIMLMHNPTIRHIGYTPHAWAYELSRRT